MSGWCILHLALCVYVFYVMYWRCYLKSTQVNVVRCLSCPASASASYNSSELLQWWNPPSQWSSTSGSISRRLRSSSPPPTAKSVGASSPANPITLRSTWLRQRGCTLVASLFTLHVIYIVHWAHRFVPLVSPWKKKRRNFNFHLSSFSNSYSWSTRLRDSSIIAL